MLDINNLFDEKFYLSQYQDVAAAVGQGAFSSGFDHFQKFGQFERRNPSGLFTEDYYLANNPDVAQAVAKGWFRAGLDHFMQYGQSEVRAGSLFFDRNFYLDFSSDVAEAVGKGEVTPIEHFVRYGQFEQRDPISEFYTDDYLDNNPDVAQAVQTTAATADPLTAIKHFIDYGQYERRNFGPDFDNSSYLRQNPDVAAAVKPGGLSAIKHYLQFGKNEGRLGTPAGNYNISLDTARDLGTLGSTSISDFVGNFNTENIYRFTLDKTSQINIALNGLSADADLWLIQDKNSNQLVDEDELLEFSEETETNPEAINTVLAAGTYFVGVIQFDGNTDYNLSLSATSATIPNDGAGNTLGTARDLGLLNSSQNFSDFIGTVDPDDFYRFTLNTRSDLNLVLNNLSADADLQLIQDINNNGIVDDVVGLVDGGEILSSSESTGSDPETIDFEGLDPGTYFVRVLQYDGDTNYNLSLSATANQLTPLPDLSGASFNLVPGTLSAESNFDVQFSVQNTQPVNAAGPFTVGFYLSQSPLITPSDFFLGNVSINELAANSTSANLTANLKLPTAGNSFWSGDRTYYIGMVVDSTNTVSESNENNNAGSGESTDFKAVAINGTNSNQGNPQGGNFDPKNNQGNNSNFTNFSIVDASSDNTPDTIFQGGAIRLRYNLANAQSLSNVRLEILGNNTVVSTQDLGSGASLSDHLINLASITNGNYQLRVVARDNSGQEFVSPELPVRVLSVERINGDFTGQTLDYAAEAGTARVVLGRGGIDTLNLSGLSPSDLTSINNINLSSFNPLSGSTDNQAIFGGTAFDYLTLADGREIYFQGIEYLSFADGKKLDLQVRPNDVSFSEQWNAFASDVPNAWRFTQGSKNVLLASMDSGIALTELTQNGSTDLTRLRYDEKTVNDESAPGDDGHGQEAISVMAGTANNNFGVTGINWNSDIYVNNVYEGGINLLQAIKDTISYARENGYARVVFQGGIQGKSWLTGGNNYTQKQLEDLINDNSDNAFFAVAAGNGGPNGSDIGERDTYRQSVSGVATLETTSSNVMAVGALRPGKEDNFWYNPNGRGIELINGLTNAFSVDLADYSNRGPNLTLVAPTDSPSVTISGQRKYFGGTSAANPNMAGMASLVWSVNPKLTGGELRQVLIDTAMDLGDPGRDNTFGFGLVNTDAAVRRAFALGRDSQVANLYSSGSLFV